MNNELPRQDFLIKTPFLTAYGTVIKKNDKWIVETIDRRMRSLIGITAKELVKKCEGWNWILEKR